MNAYLFPALSITPKLLRSAFLKTPEGALDCPTHPGRFSPREVVAHMADWEPILLARMKQCVESPGSTIRAYDEGEMAVENSYGTSDPVVKLAEFESARAETLLWLKSLTPGQWSSSAVHEERGPQSVYDIANTMVGHDVYHIEQLSALERG